LLLVADAARHVAEYVRSGRPPSRCRMAHRTRVPAISGQNAAVDEAHGATFAVPSGLLIDRDGLPELV
jgi:hypothetical protein